MIEISKDLVQKLREMTNVGMMDCKKALIEANGDLDEARQLLRKKGLAVATKRADNATENGIVSGLANNNSAAIAELSCETDFAARTPAMQKFLQEVVECATMHEIDGVEQLLECQFAPTGLKIQAMLDELIAKISESIKLSRVRTFKGNANSLVSVYVHPDYSVSTMVELEADQALTDQARTTLGQLAKDICMQIAVTNPAAVRPEELPAKMIEQEKEAALAQLAASGKPAAMLDKILQGKLQKFYEDACLLNQKFIKDDKVTVMQKLDDAAKALGLKCTVKQIARFGVNR